MMRLGLTDLETFVKSAPVDVHLAGMVGTTVSLVENGWDISMETHRYADFSEQGLLFAFRHQGTGLYGLSDLVPWSTHGPFNLDYYKNMCINIRCLSNTIRVHHMSSSTAMTAFSPVNATPECVRASELNLADLVPFRTVAIGDSKDIVVPEYCVDELLEMVSKKQAPKQKELRSKQVRERMNRQEGTGEILNFNPQSEIRAQIVVVGG